MDPIKHELRRSIRRSTRTQQAAFTVLELLVSIAVVAILLSMLLPAVMNARESARRMTCSSHLRELGVAMHRFHDINRRLPRAWEGKDGETFAFGWASKLLPLIEPSAMRTQLEGLSPRGELNTSDEASRRLLTLMLCPSDIIEPSFQLWTDADDDHSLSVGFGRPATPVSIMWLPAASYAGVYGTNEADDFADQTPQQQLTFADGCVVNSRTIAFRDIRRGLSNTMLVGERKMATVPTSWLGVDLRGEDAPCRLVGSAMTSPNCDACDECEFSSRHSGGSNFLWADGHISLVSDSIDSVVYRLSAKRHE